MPHVRWVRGHLPISVAMQRSSPQKDTSIAIVIYWEKYKKKYMR
jgi:hypothetical protein